MKAKAPAERELIDAIEAATRSALTDLFASHPEHFYYVSLITTEEGHAPFLSAWSMEALADAAGVAEARRGLLRWSYADSPYCCWGKEHYGDVGRLFSARPPMTLALSDREWAAELDLRLRAMEAAMKRLDESGLFGTGSRRNEIVINVEVMPPDSSNTDRARRLNPPQAIQQWLVEAAEE